MAGRIGIELAVLLTLMSVNCLRCLAVIVQPQCIKVSDVIDAWQSTSGNKKTCLSVQLTSAHLHNCLGTWINALRNFEQITIELNTVKFIRAIEIVASSSIGSNADVSISVSPKSFKQRMIVSDKCDTRQFAWHKSQTIKELKHEFTSAFAECYKRVRDKNKMTAICMQKARTIAFDFSAVEILIRRFNLYVEDWPVIEVTNSTIEDAWQSSSSPTANENYTGCLKTTGVSVLSNSPALISINVANGNKNNKDNYRWLAIILINPVFLMHIHTSQSDFQLTQWSTSPLFGNFFGSHCSNSAQSVAQRVWRNFTLCQRDDDWKDSGMTNTSVTKRIVCNKWTWTMMAITQQERMLISFIRLYHSHVPILDVRGEGVADSWQSSTSSQLTKTENKSFCYNGVAVTGDHLLLVTKDDWNEWLMVLLRTQMLVSYVAIRVSNKRSVSARLVPSELKIWTGDDVQENFHSTNLSRCNGGSKNIQFGSTLGLFKCQRAFKVVDKKIYGYGETEGLAYCPGKIRRLMLQRESLRGGINLFNLGLVADMPQANGIDAMGVMRLNGSCWRVNSKKNDGHRLSIKITCQDGELINDSVCCFTRAATSYAIMFEDFELKSITSMTVRTAAFAPSSIKTKYVNRCVEFTWQIEKLPNAEITLECPHGKFTSSVITLRKCCNLTFYMDFNATIVVHKSGFDNGSVSVNVKTPSPYPHQMDMHDSCVTIVWKRVENFQTQVKIGNTTSEWLSLINNWTECNLKSAQIYKAKVYFLSTYKFQETYREDIQVKTAIASPDVRVNNVNDSCVDISWSQLASINYSVQLGTKIVLKNTRSTNTICQLTPATEYSVTVVGKKHGFPNRSSTILVKTRIPKPSDIRVAKRTAGCISLTWNSLNDTKVKHRVEAANAVCRSRNRTCAVCCFANDSIRILVNVTGVKSGFQDSATASLASIVRIPIPKVTHLDSNGTCVKIAWSKTPVDGIEYLVSLRGGTKFFISVYSHTTNSTTLGKAIVCQLQPAMNYTISVVAYSNELSDNVYGLINVQTEIPKPVVEVINVTSTCATVKFSPPESIGIFRVIRQLDSSSRTTTTTRRRIQIVSTGIFSVVCGLNPASVNNFTVNSEKVGYRGSEAEIVSIRTRVPKPGNFRIASRQYGWIGVTWDSQHDKAITYVVDSVNASCTMANSSYWSCKSDADAISIGVIVTGFKKGFAQSESVSLTAIVTVPQPDAKFVSSNLSCVYIVWRLPYSLTHARSLTFRVSVNGVQFKETGGSEIWICNLTSGTNFIVGIVTVVDNYLLSDPAIVRTQTKLLSPVIETKSVNSTSTLIIWQQKPNNTNTYSVVCGDEGHVAEFGEGFAACRDLLPGEDNPIIVTAHKLGFPDSMPTKIIVKTKVTKPELINQRPIGKNGNRIFSWTVGRDNLVTFRLICHNGTTRNVQRGVGMCVNMKKSVSGRSIAVITASKEGFPSSQSLKIPFLVNLPKPILVLINSTCSTVTLEWQEVDIIGIRGRVLCLNNLCRSVERIRHGVKFSNLMSATNYSFSVVFRHRLYADSDALLASILTKLPMPKILRAERIDRQCILVTWQPESDESIYFTATCLAVQQSFRMNLTSLKCCEFNNPDDEKDVIEVTAKKQGFPPSDTAVYFFWKQLPTPEVYNLSATSRCISFNWTDYNIANMIHYIRIIPANENVELSKFPFGATICNLRSATEYWLSLQASERKKFWQRKTRQFKCTTRIEKPNPRYKFLSDRSCVNVSWTPEPPDRKVKYKVDCATGIGTEIHLHWALCCLFNVSNQHNFVQRVTVIGQKDDFPSSLPGYVTLMLKLPTPVLQVEMVKSTSVLVVWNSLSRFKVDSQAKCGSEQPWMSVDTSSVLCKNLPPASAVKISVRHVSNYLPNGKASSIYAYTRVNAPDYFQAKETELNCVALYWTASPDTDVEYFVDCGEGVEVKSARRREFAKCCRYGWKAESRIVKLTAKKKRFSDSRTLIKRVALRGKGANVDLGKTLMIISILGFSTSLVFVTARFCLTDIVKDSDEHRGSSGSTTWIPVTPLRNFSRKLINATAGHHLNWSKKSFTVEADNYSSRSERQDQSRLNNGIVWVKRSDY